VLLGAIAVMAVVFDGHFEIKRWLFWRYASYWLLAVGFCACCTAAGFALVHRITSTSAPLREQLVFGCAVGVLVFVIAWFSLGLIGQLNAFWFVSCPLALGGLGLFAARKSWFRLLRHRRLFRNRQPASLLRSVLFFFGTGALLLAYLPILTPRNLAADAHWYHMRMAETYAVADRIFPFSEGWLMGAYPQLATLLYSWAFELPNGILFDHIELAAHLEFVLFLATLAFIPVLVRRVLPRGTSVQTRWAWTAMFLFPEIFLYDSSLTGAADHIAALWAVPLFLALFRAQRALALPSSLVLGLITSGVLLTKYSAYGLVLFPALVIFVRLITLLVRSWRERRAVLPPLRSAAAMVAVILVCTAPHWLKNLAWYGDPLFPWLHRWLEPGPWSPEAEPRVARFMLGWPAERSWQGVKATLLSPITFSFIPNDWWTFHRDWPVFGSLFTVTTPLLFFFRGVRRIAAIYVGVNLGIVYWYWTFHQDRYLQLYLPLMASAVAAVLVLVWRAGVVPRILCCTLIGLQLAWGGDVPFFPTHGMLGTTPLKTSIDFLSSSFTGTRKTWFKPPSPLGDMREVLPRDAKVLLHDDMGHVGLGRVTVADLWQTSISYVRAPAPDRIYDRLRSFGVTHVLWKDAASAEDTVGSDLAFYSFARRYTKNQKPFGNYTVAEMPSAKPDPADFKDRALYLGCNDSYQTGLYRISDLNLWPFDPPAKESRPPLTRITSAQQATSLYPSVDALLVNHGCFAVSAQPAKHGFVKAATRERGYELWVRSR
jgi:hypothetical protein